MALDPQEKNNNLAKAISRLAEHTFFHDRAHCRAVINAMTGRSFDRTHASLGFAFLEAKIERDASPEHKQEALDLIKEAEEIAFS